MANDPITVTEAIAAMEREIAEAKDFESRLAKIQAAGSWLMLSSETHWTRYRAALEYLLKVLHGFDAGGPGEPLLPRDEEYAAVAPIVARWREEDKR